MFAVYYLPEKNPFTLLCLDMPESLPNYQLYCETTKTLDHKLWKMRQFRPQTMIMTLLWKVTTFMGVIKYRQIYVGTGLMNKCTGHKHSETIFYYVGHYSWAVLVK